MNDQHDPSQPPFEPDDTRPVTPPDAPDSMAPHETAHDSQRVLPPDPALAGAAGGGELPPKQRFVDRLWSLRAVIAVALASVIIGGLGGAALASAGSDNDGRRGPGRFQRGPMGPPGFQNGQHGPNQFPGRQGQGQRQWDHTQQGQLQPGSPPTPQRQRPTPTPSPTPTPTR